MSVLKGADFKDSMLTKSTLRLFHDMKKSYKTINPSIGLYSFNECDLPNKAFLTTAVLAQTSGIEMRSSAL